MPYNHSHVTNTLHADKQTFTKWMISHVLHNRHERHISQLLINNDNDDHLHHQAVDFSLLSASLPYATVRVVLLWTCPLSVIISYGKSWCKLPVFITAINLRLWPPRGLAPDWSKSFWIYWESMSYWCLDRVRFTSLPFWSHLNAQPATWPRP